MEYISHRVAEALTGKPMYPCSHVLVVDEEDGTAAIIDGGHVIWEGSYEEVKKYL